MGERRGTKGLELWCKKLTEGYPGVKIENMTTSWRDGLAFCAIIHHFRPELIDFKKLKKEDVYANNELAFRVAEQYLGIPALLEAEDMVEYAVPDRLSILTYLSQFYQAFAVVTAQGSPSRMVPKRPSNTTGIVSPASTSPPNKKMSGVPTGVLTDIPRADILRLKPCAKCTLPVFFAERLNVGKLLYHRTCFRCARCNNQLTLANCYETETPNQYCCETCPDEEPPQATEQDDAATGVSIPILSRSLSDEEKTAGLKSCLFETALEHSVEVFKPRESSAGLARKSFLQVSMLAANDSDDEEVKVPELPHSARPRVLGLSEHQSDIIKSNSDSGRPDSDSVNSLSRDVKVQSTRAKDLSGFSMVKARMRLFENKREPKPTIVTKVTEIDLSAVTEPKVPIAKDKLNVEDEASLNVADQSDSISLVDKENVVVEDDQKSVLADSIYESIITVSDETISSQDLSRTEYKTTCEDSVITITDESNIEEHEESEDTDIDRSLADSKTEYKIIEYDLSSSNQDQNSVEHSIITNPDSVITITDESNIEEHEESEDTDIDKSLADSKTEYKIIEYDLSSSNQDQNSVEHSIITNPEVSSPVDDRSNKTNPRTSFEDSVIISNVEEQSYEGRKEPNRFNIQSEVSTDITEVKQPQAKQENIDNDSIQIDSGLHSMQPSEADTKCVLGHESYPGDLNPFGEDEDEGASANHSTNPFDDDANEEQNVEPSTPPKFNRLIKLDDEDRVTFTPGPIQVLRISEVCPTSETMQFKKPVPAARKKIPAPKISLIPFWDSDDESSTQESRHTRTSTERHPQPKPRVSDVSSTSITSPHGSSTTSLSSITTTSSVQSGKKKKAPAPPKPMYDSGQNSLTSSPSTSVQHSPRSTPRPRKSKKAPAPPTLASTPSGLTIPHAKISISPIQFDNTKVTKDELNRNRKSQTFNEPTSPTTIHTPDKSTFGKWKRKKNIAPDKPIAIRRTIKELPMVEVKRELDVIEMQQQGLERQGVKVEHIIRMRCESVDSELNEDNIPIEVEDMILQLFEIVNEKNELFRRQTELMYLKKQHRLDEEHAEVEYQIRCLMLTPDKNKTDTDKSKEEELIRRLIEIVEKKNEIIECLDMDRVREYEEDHSFTSSMNSYANRRDITPSTNTLSNDDSQSLSKKEKKKFKKKFKLKLGGGSHQHVDADKDIDETEVNQAKEKKKKKFAIF